MAKKNVIVVVVVASIIAALGCLWMWGWFNRQTLADRKAERKQVVKEFREASADRVLPFLEELVHSSALRSDEKSSFPWVKLSYTTRVPADFIAQLIEESVIRFAGTGVDGSEDVAHLKPIVALAGEFISKCETPAAANQLRERKMDGHFILKEYDAAIAMLETPEGIPGHSKEWCAGTAAKLRAHKALDAGDKKEAAKQFALFGKLLNSDEMKNFEDCDPTTGIVYSIDWVVARNLMRCANLAKEAGDNATAEKYTAEAKPRFKVALEKAKDDKKSLQALQEDMKKFGL